MLRKDSFTERFGVAPRAPDQELHVIPAVVRRGFVTILQNLVANDDNLNSNVNKNVFHQGLYRSLFICPSIQRMYRFDAYTYRNPDMIPDELDNITEDCQWNAFFDAVEACSKIVSAGASVAAADFEYNFNELLVENGVQWVLRDGKVERRRPEPVATAIEKTVQVLTQEGFERPNTQLLKALHALDERPEPDVENCVKDAVGALEGTARTLVGKPSASLSTILNSEPFKTTVHPTLRDALLKVEAYRGDAPGAGHALVTGKLPINVADAEFALTTCTAGILLLIEKAKPTA